MIERMDEHQNPMIAPDPTKIPAGQLVQNFSSRQELDAAMGKLTAAGLPSQAFFVVGHDVKQVEYFMGKLSYPRVALSAAFSGAVFGAMIGVATALLTGTSVMPHLATAIPLGIAIWMISAIFSFSRANPNSSFQMKGHLVPSAFSLMASSAVAAHAREVLGSPSSNFAAPAPQQFSAHHSQQPVAPQQGQQPTFTPPTEAASFVGPEFNKDGSKAGGKYGLRIEDPEEFAQTVRKEPAPVATEKTSPLGSQRVASEATENNEVAHNDDVRGGSVSGEDHDEHGSAGSRRL